jgi:hypothetical protein
MIVSCEPLVGIDFIRVLGTGRGCFACAMQDGQNANAKYYDEPKEVIDEKPLFLIGSELQLLGHVGQLWTKAKEGS